MIETKAFRFGEIKAGPADGLKEGQMRAYASIFGNVDSYGDVVMKGAFTDSLKEWKASDRSMPLLYLHNLSDPFMNIGVIEEAEEDSKGLKILAQYDLDAESPVARKVYGLVKGRRINELSFAYDVVKSVMVDDKDRPKVWRELHAVKIHEASVVPFGANPETEVIAIKSATESLVRGLKAGRTLSAANEKTLRTAYDSIVSASEALASVLPSQSDADGKSGAPGPHFGDLDVEKLAALVAAKLTPTPPEHAGQGAPDPLVLEVQRLTLPTF